MNRISFRHTLIRKISKRDYRGDIEKIKQKVKEDPSVRDKFKEYNVSLNDIDSVEVEVLPLDVSAKTKNMVITLNERLFNSDLDPAEYLAHELTHYLQQKTNNMDGHYEVDDYLLKLTETEAFEVQMDYKKREQSEEDAEEYVEDLLDYHDVEDKDRKKIKDKLL